MLGRLWQDRKRRPVLVLGILVVLFVLIQFVPVDKTNPPVVQEPTWDSPRTRELVQAACFDCHSNETVWPWYGNVAPVSWLLALDVDRGRAEANFSEWSASEKSADDFAEVIRDGEMPPFYYVLMHSEADLSDAEKDELIAGLRATLGAGGMTGDQEDSDG